MKKILFFSLLLAMVSCAGESAPSDNQQESPLETQEAPTATPQTVSSTSSVKTNLTLSAPQRSLKTGETVCLDITVADFHNLIAMQYSMKWDPAVLQFQEVKGFALPHMSAQNFGVHRIAEGILTSVWIDNSLRGITLSDGSPIFQVCMKAVGKSGQSTTFNFVDTPTPFEVVTVKEEVLSINSVEGVIRVD